MSPNSCTMGRRKKFTFAVSSPDHEFLVTSAKEDMFSSFVCLSVCVFVSNFVQKLPNRFASNL